MEEKSLVDPAEVVDDIHVATCEDFISREVWVHFVC